MKWVGQHIYNLISRFRDDVYLERLSTTNEKSVLVVDSDGKISKNTNSTIDQYLTFTNTGNVSTLSLLSNQDTDDLFYFSQKFSPALRAGFYLYVFLLPN